LASGIKAKFVRISYESPHYFPTTIKDFDEQDIKSYKSSVDIFKSGRFTSEERKREYRRRGKSPSGVIDGVYNDFNVEEGEVYNDFNRDWDADA
jgi:hypothetical protein